MMGLVYKDIMVMKKQLYMYLSFYVFYGFLTATGAFDLSILGGLTAMFGVLVVVSAVAYDEQAKWDRFAVATPLGRRGVVGGKYLLPLVIVPAAVVLTGAVETVLCLAGLAEANLWEALAADLICGVAAVFLDAFLLPLLFKFGTEKARVLFLLLFAFCFGGSMLLGKLARGSAALPAVSLPLLAALGLAFVAAAYALSYFISVGIMERKEL